MDNKSRRFIHLHHNFQRQRQSSKMLLSTFIIYISMVWSMGEAMSDFAGENSSERSTDNNNSNHLNEKSVVLITGAAGYLGSELAIALHHTYGVTDILCVDAFDSEAPRQSPPSVTQDNSTTPEQLKQLQREILSLFEYKRQRIFRLMQSVPTVKFFKADFRSMVPEFYNVGHVDLLDRISSEYDVTHIIHLADTFVEGNDANEVQAVPRKRESPRGGMMESILEHIKKINLKSKGERRQPQFVYASSYEVYDIDSYNEGAVKKGMNEFDPLTTPMNLHGASKIIDEILASTYHSMNDILSVGLRFFPVYGPWAPPGSALFKMAERAVSKRNSSILNSNIGDVVDMFDCTNEDEFVEGSDSNAQKESTEQSSSSRRSCDALQFDFVYIDDAIDAIMSAMQYNRPTKAAGASVFNVGSGIATSLDAIANKMNYYFPRHSMPTSSSTVSEKKHQSKATLSTTRDISALSNDLIKNHLGWHPQHTLQDGIIKLLAWHFNRAFPQGSSTLQNSSILAPASHNGKDEHSSNSSTNANNVFIASHGVESCSPLDDECLLGIPVFPCSSECSNLDICTPSIYDEAVIISTATTEGCEIVLYTVSLGLDVEDIPSGRMAVTPNSLPFIKSINGLNCNIAFVTEGSNLMKYASSSSRVEVNVGGKLGGWNKIALKQHGFWTLIGVPDVAETIDGLTPKLSPGKFFASSVNMAIYSDPNVLFSNLPELLKKLKNQPPAKGDHYSEFTGNVENSIVMMASSRPEYTSSLDEIRGTYASTTPAEALQERAYNMIRIGLKGNMAALQAKVNTRWLVHNINSKDSQLFRCSVYREVLQWKVSNDEAAFFFMIELHDLWYRFDLKSNENDLEGRNNFNGEASVDDGSSSKLKERRALGKDVKLLDSDRDDGSETESSESESESESEREQAFLPRGEGAEETNDSEQKSDEKKEYWVCISSNFISNWIQILPSFLPSITYL